MKKEISAGYSKALELHNKIMVSAQLVQSNLWEMCAGLKEMRDDKLYKELGYQNFEEYCGSEFNMTSRNARYYISIIENISEEKRKTFSTFSSSKLMLLSTLSEAEQEQIATENDVESLTVKQLEAEIKRLKTDNQRIIGNHNDVVLELDKTREKNRNLNNENVQLQQQIEELENRPIEFAVAEPSDNERRLQETIKALERKNIKEYDELERRYREDEQAVRRMLEKDKEDAIKALTAEYEEKLKAAALSQDDETEDGALKVLGVYYEAAHDALFRLIGYANGCMDKTACFSKIKTLLVEFEKLNDELIYGR